MSSQFENNSNARDASSPDHDRRRIIQTIGVGGAAALAAPGLLLRPAYGRAAR